MNNSVFIYLVHRLVFRVTSFFHHWYIHGGRLIGHKLINVLENLDKTFALRITLTHLFQPLYKDYTIVGRIVGPIFRMGRVIIASLIYFVVIIFFLLIFIFWFSIPPLIILYIFFDFRAVNPID